MEQKIIQRVLRHPEFHKMAHKKALLGWSFSTLMLLVYVVYILFIAFKPEYFAIPVSEGSVTTWGIYFGLAVIIFAFVITGIYVYKANGEFETLTQKVVQEVKGEKS